MIPNLTALEEQVAVSNQTLVAALANFQAARAVVKEARSQLFPDRLRRPVSYKITLRRPP